MYVKVDTSVVSVFKQMRDQNTEVYAEAACSHHSTLTLEILRDLLICARIAEEFLCLHLLGPRV